MAKIQELQTLFRTLGNSTPLFTSFMEEKGFSKELLRKYVKSGWLKRLSRGVYLSRESELSPEGLVFSLQKQKGLDIWPAAKTALNMHNTRQYVTASPEFTTFCYDCPNKVPAIAKETANFNISYTKLFDNAPLGITQLKDGLPIYLSSRERAFLELVYSIKTDEDFKEASEILELLRDLRSALLMKLLISCQNIKTKRVFLFLANHANHSWFKSLYLNMIYLGKGPRQVIPHGLYDDQFQITIPRDFYELQ